MSCITSCQTICSPQFGFCSDSSTQEALLYATDDWHIHLDIDYSVTAVLFDLSKDFDKVPQSKLIYVLRDFGISGLLLKWFQSYLSGRQQRVVLNSQFSSTCPVNSGIPQCSILGPLLSQCT